MYGTVATGGAISADSANQNKQVASAHGNCAEAMIVVVATTVGIVAVDGAVKCGMPPLPVNHSVPGIVRSSFVTSAEKNSNAETTPRLLQLFSPLIRL